MPPYVPERKVEHWTSQQIVEFFRSVDIECRSFPIQGRIEDIIPADFVFGGNDLTKVFGLQYKSLYRGSPDFWPLNNAQHRALKAFSWIYYALSELREPSAASIALHALWLTHPTFRYRKKLECPPYAAKISPGPWHGVPAPELHRWYDFYLDLRRCNVGVRVEDQADFTNLFAPVWRFDDVLLEAERMADYFAINFDRREALRFTTMPLLES